MHRFAIQAGSLLFDKAIVRLKDRKAFTIGSHHLPQCTGGE